MDGEPRLRVLIVDDDQSVRGFLRRAVEASGLAALEAADGASAMGMLGSDEAVDVALVDGLLPDMHGVELGRRALVLPGRERMGLCLLSGAVQGRVPTAAGVACLAKPVRPADLVAELRRLGDWSRDGGSPLPERVATLDRMAMTFLVGP